MGKMMLQFGLDLKKLRRSLKGLPSFVIDLVHYKQAQTHESVPIKITNLYPILHEKFAQAGDVDWHYFFQDIWAARKIFKNKPERHVDIGSSIGGLIAHLLVFREVEVVDIRPLKHNVDNLRFIQDDATKLEQFQDDSLGSVSSLHAAEHFGLGRYGDTVDPNAHIKFMKSLARVLKPGGRLYFALPVGKERVEFNAQRVLSPLTVLHIFKDLKLLSFSAVKGAQFCEIIDPVSIKEENFACGLFEFTK
jgi:SAM-dependent methyltransferase